MYVGGAHRAHVVRRRLQSRQLVSAMMLLSHVLHFYFFIVLARGWSSGAPTETCSDIYPAGHNGTNSLDLQANPYRLDLTAFDELGGTLYYVADQCYKSELATLCASRQPGFMVNYIYT